MNINRYEKNPIIKPEDVIPLHENFEVIGSFNAGVAKFGDETILLLRIAERPISEEGFVDVPIVNIEEQVIDFKKFSLDDPKFDFSDPRMVKSVDKLEGFTYLTSLSYIRIARSYDGINFTIDDGAFIYPENEYQIYGVEDARCTQIGDDYYVNFTSVSPKGVLVTLVVTKDFKQYKSLGNIFSPENKDVLIFPEKIKGKYYALHRPSLKSIGNYDIWIASSPDLVSWGNHQFLMGITDDSWDNGRIGGGLVPIRTKEGWLEIYHGATTENRYCMGAVLLDLDDPTKVIGKSENPIMEPDVIYEQEGFFGDVVFGCGGIVDNDTLIMYYGVSDTSMAVCEMNISEILKQIKVKG